MSVAEPDRARLDAFGRVGQMLFGPARGWSVVADEPASPGSLYRRYVVPLALIPAVCEVIGQAAFGAGVAGIRIRPSLAGSLADAALGYLASLVAVHVLAV